MDDCQLDNNADANTNAGWWSVDHAGSRDVAAAVALSLFSRSPHGWFIVDRHARILHRNRTAQALLAESPHVRDHDGVLSVGPPTMHARFLRHLAEATAGAARHDPPTATGLAIPRADRCLPYVVLIAAVHAPDAARGAQLATVTIIDPNRRVDGAASLLARLFDLSDAERRVAVGIANGERLADIADAATVRLSTVRSQLKAVLRKTGARRQGDVVRLVHNLLD